MGMLLRGYGGDWCGAGKGSKERKKVIHNIVPSFFSSRFLGRVSYFSSIWPVVPRPKDGQSQHDS